MTNNQPTQESIIELAVRLAAASGSQYLTEVPTSELTGFSTIKTQPKNGK